MTTEDKINKLKTIYLALQRLPDCEAEAATRAVASTRLLLIDLVGEEQQQGYIADWNNITENQ